jgi:hypothetical protein
MKAFITVLAAVVGIGLLPSNANAVLCWYCVHADPMYPLQGWCERRLYTGDQGYTSCYNNGSTCVVGGNCPYTVLGPAGTDATGTPVGGCASLSLSPGSPVEDAIVPELVL